MIIHKNIKQTIITVIAVMMILIINDNLKAQVKDLSSKDIPQPVIDSFLKNFPKAYVTGFEKEKSNGVEVYELESMQGNVKRDIEFTADGSIVEIGEYIDVSALPLNIKNSFNANFNNAKILEVEKKTRGSVIEYEVVFSNGAGKKEVLLNSDGKMIKDNEDNETDEDSEETD